jgi:polyhydroxyalkanoate synthesis regulator phasin
VAELREAISRRVIAPLDLMMLTRDRIEEAVEDAVSRGRLTSSDAQELVQSLVTRGRKQTRDVLSDLEQLLGRGRTSVESRADRAVTAAETARKQVEGATSRARKRAADAADPLVAQADRARRAVGVGPSFPIIGYDDLSAAQIQSRLAGLTPAELRKVRDYESRNANRKSVLNAINTKLR